MQPLRRGSGVDSDRVLSGGVRGESVSVKSPLPDGTDNGNTKKASAVVKTKIESILMRGLPKRDVNEPKLVRTGFKPSPRFDNYRTRKGLNPIAVSKPVAKTKSPSKTPRTVYYPTIVTSKPMSTQKSKCQNDLKSFSAPILPATFDVNIPDKTAVVSSPIPFTSDNSFDHLQRAKSRSGSISSETETPRKIDLPEVMEIGEQKAENPLLSEQDKEVKQERDQKQAGETALASSESENDSGTERNVVSSLPDIGGGASDTQPIDLRDEMPHSSFMEASRRNIAASLSTISKARERLDKSLPIDIGRPSTVASFPAIQSVSVGADAEKSQEIESGHGDKEMKATWRRSRSMSDIQLREARGARSPSNMAWRPAKALSHGNHNGGTRKKPGKEPGQDTTDREQNGELPLLTGRNQFVYFEPGIVAFEDCDSANVYYNSLFRVVRRSMCSVYKYKDDNFTKNEAES